YLTTPRNPFYLASGNPSLSLRASQLVFDHLRTVEPMLHMIAMNNQPHLIPLANRMQHLVFRRNQIVQSARGTITIFAHLRVRMLIIVQHLHFKPQSRVAALHHIFINKILDAAVSSGTDAPLQLQFKVIVLPYRYDIAALFTLFAVAGYVFDCAAFNRPALVRHLFSSKPTPSVPCFAIEQQLPSCRFFRRREYIYCRVRILVRLSLGLPLSGAANLHYTDDEKDGEHSYNNKVSLRRTMVNINSHIGSKYCDSTFRQTPQKPSLRLLNDLSHSALNLKRNQHRRDAGTPETTKSL